MTTHPKCPDPGRPLTRQEMYQAELYRRSMGYEMGMGPAPGESEFLALVRDRTGCAKVFEGRKKSLSELIHGDVGRMKTEWLLMKYGPDVYVIDTEMNGND